MIITKTPYRVSFFGGGTDYFEWFKEHPGACLSVTINRYAYISVRRLPPFHSHKTRVVWSEIENVSRNSEIRHPAIRGCLEYLGIEDGLEIHHDGDLPGRSGMGSSAAFTVGLLHALHAVKSEMISKRTLAIEAMEVDQDVVGETVGTQDHISCAFGGLNRIDFREHRAHFSTTPIIMDKDRLSFFSRHLMLFYTGIDRHASEVAASQVAKFDRSRSTLQRMVEMVDEGQALLVAGRFREFGLLLHEGWLLKRSLGASSERIDDLYGAALKAGALGGKILGAGKGGMLMLFAGPDISSEVKRAMESWGLLHVPFWFELQGSQVVYYSED